MKYNNTASTQFNHSIQCVDENDLSVEITDSDTSANIQNNKTKRYSNLYSSNITEQFKDMQDSIMNKEIPILSKLLAETTFEIGYESIAEMYFNQLSDRYGIIADAVLQNIYLKNIYDNQYLLKHLLFIVENLSADRRSNLEIIPLAGISNPDIEIQDLSVKCFEAWGERRHLPTLISLRDRTNIEWFRNYISDVINELSEE